MSNLQKFFEGKKVLITGHTGFKGSWLSHVLVHWGAHVVGVSLAPNTKPSLFTTLGLKNRMKSYIADVRDFKTVNNIVKREKPEIVFHLAGQAIVYKGHSHPLETYSTNILGTVHVLEAIRLSSSVRSGVIITTDKVYKNEEWVHPYRENDRLGSGDPYAASKAAADIVGQSYTETFFGARTPKSRTLIAIARAGNVIGGGDWAPQRIIPDIMRAVYEKKKPVIIRNPGAVRPWEHVLEPLSGYLLLAKKLYEGDTSAVGAWNFGPDDKNFLSVEALLQKILDILHEGTYKVVPDKNIHEANLLYLDIAKIKTLLHWHPTLSLDETLHFTCDWYKEFYGGAGKKKLIDLTNEQISSFFGR